MPEKPLMVAISSERAVLHALRGVECDLLAFSNTDRILATKFPRGPRLFLIEVTKEPDRSQEVIRKLRRQRPLTDVLAWAPQASGPTVRMLFQTGVKDVILSRSPSRLAVAVEDILEGQQFLPRLDKLSRDRARGSRFEGMLSRSVAMWDLFDICTRVAPSEATVLIVGETGTGKELLARAVHRRSGRKGRFVAANCASISPELINSELFGHEKGAFTGADRAKKGLVMHANEGTLFLDEVGDMPAEAQQSLLRMLQEKRIRSVGSQTETEVDARIVAATNVMLDEAVRLGSFREDLFYRLDVIRINVPALRERPEDILFLFGHFTKRLSKQYGLGPPTFSDSFLDALVAYAWPGNVRQLENFCERLVLARPQRSLSKRDFARLRNSSGIGTPTTIQHAPAIAPSTVDLTQPLQREVAKLVERYERKYLELALKENKGRVGDTARKAQMSRRTLLRKMNQYNIRKSDFKT